MALYRDPALRDHQSRQRAELLAIAALAFLADDPERLNRFLTASGLSPQQLRSVAPEPEFLAGVLDHLGSEEALLLAFAAHAGIDPRDIASARRALPGGSWTETAR
jgi:hypothetical protein